MKLKPKEICPLHRRRDCCGRQEFHRYPRAFHAIKFNLGSDGTKKFPDGREVCPKSVMKRRKDMLIRQNPVCAGCGEKFTDYDEIELAHKESKGMGAAKRDDRWDNLCLMHREENQEQGSRSLDQYLADKAATQ